MSIDNSDKILPMRLKYYDIVFVLFVMVVLISNIVATKLLQVGPFILDGGAVLFPFAYILGDILTEVYGFRRARRAILMGIVSMVIAVGVFSVVQYLPYPDSYANQSAYEAVIGFMPRIAAASLAAFAIGEFINSYVLVYIKRKTNKKYLWMRLIGSTVVGGFFDTVVFCMIAFAGIVTGAEMLNYILTGWIFKTLVEVVVLPLTYRLIAWLKKSENLPQNIDMTGKMPLPLGK